MQYSISFGTGWLQRIGRQRFLCLLVSSLLLTLPLRGQQPTIQDCLGAIPVCVPVYQESQSPSGVGNYNQEIGPGQTCNFNETNSIWYIFTASQSGQLGFLITPNDLNDDYDWVLFDLTNVSCQNIRNSNNVVVSCNAAGGGTCNGLTGATGGSNSNNQGAGCSGGNSAFNALVPMQAGQTFALLVNNWTGSPNGFTINFGLSTGLGIFDQQPPRVDNVVVQPRRCGENAVRLRFTENIRCNSLSSSAFSLTGPGGPYTVTASSTACQQLAGATREINLTISPPVQQLGNYTLTINPLQASHLLDQCGNQLADTSLVLVVNQPLPLQPDLGPDLNLNCPGDSVVLSTPITDAQYLWSDGSTGRQLVVSSPGVYRLTVTNACGQGVDSLTVSRLFDLPTVDLGPDQQLCPGQTILLGGSGQRERIPELIAQLERQQPADLRTDAPLVEGVWELRWSSSSQPYLATAPWLSNLQVLAPSRSQGMNLLRLAGPLGEVAGIAVRAAIAIEPPAAADQPCQRVSVRFEQGGWLGPSLGGQRLRLLRQVRQSFPAWLDITVVDQELRVCRGNAGTVFALLRRPDLSLEELLG